MKQKEVLKDSNKGQKILAAAYLVSAHLSDNDPLKQALRSAAIGLVTVDVSESVTLLEGFYAKLRDLLGASVLAGLISEKNSAIIVVESEYYVRAIVVQHAEKEALGQSLSAMFAEAQGVAVGVSALSQRVPVMVARTATPPSQTTRHGLRGTDTSTTDSHGAFNTTNAMHTPERQGSVSEKTDRQAAIVSLINDRKSATIKDIVTLFPDVSEKTVQRELIALVASGSITKRGEKRWSVYMSVA